MDKETGKEQLKNIKDNDYAVHPGMKVYELSVRKMDNIGDIDSELRDDMISPIC